MKDGRQKAEDRGWLPARYKQRMRGLLLVVYCFLLFVVPAQAQSNPASSALLREIRIDQHLNAQVPLDLVFRDEVGRDVQLRDYFGSRPVILTLVYYDCPMLCTMVLNDLTSSLAELKFNVGEEFDVVTVSFDPREGPALAAAKKELYLKRYGRPGASTGWHFLTGDEANIKRLAEAVGFHYAWDAATDQYAHASGIMVLTPQGKLARYFYGIEYPPRDLRFGLIEASQGKIGTPVDQVLLLCYHYDVATGRYGTVAFNFMRLGGLLTVVGLAAFVFVMLRKEKNRSLPPAVAGGYEHRHQDPPATAGGSDSDTQTQGTLSSFLPLAFLLLPLFPDAASTEAQHVDALFYFMLAVCGAVATGVCCLIIYFAVKYRRRTDDQLALPARSPTWLELSWTIIPFFIFIGMFLWGARLYFVLARPPADAIEINVVAKQWMWKFQHAEGQREINELHVPVNRPIKLTLGSEDVIHSFYVPAFRLHQDVVPGRYRTTWFEATETGSYHLFCSQYCGTQHSGMGGYVIVMEPADYQRWLSSGGEGSLASQGQKLFRQLACNECHTGTAQARGPVLDSLYGSTVQLDNGETVRADESYLRESIVNPRAKTVAGFQPIMPTFQNQLDEEQLLELIAYIKSLASGREQIPSGSSPAGPQPSPVAGALKRSTGQAQKPSQGPKP